jgi:hypothetical protein
MGVAVRLLLCLACASSSAAAFDEFDQRVCEAQTTTNEKVECYKELLPESICRYSDGERALGCFRNYSKTRLGPRYSADLPPPPDTHAPRIPAGTASGVFTTLECYARSSVPCGFNDMLLSFCNQQGNAHGSEYEMSGRSYLHGGNSFRSTDGMYICRVNRIKGTEPARYQVVISRY